MNALFFTSVGVILKSNLSNRSFWLRLASLSFLLLSLKLWGQPAAISQTKIKIKQLDKQIQQLQYKLGSFKDKRGLLSQELAKTERQIATGKQQLQSLQQTLQKKQQEIASLKQALSSLNKQLHAQQNLLARHVRARFTMGHYQPFKWLITQDQPYGFSRLLTFYQYLIQSRQKIIANIELTSRNLRLNQKLLKDTLHLHQELEQKLIAEQQKLDSNKQYHASVLQALNQEIQANQHQLQQVAQDKDNLSSLLKTLVAQSQVSVKKPFTAMRQKLPRPIQAKTFQKMNQGLTFFAANGTPVKAVYFGKVVFSDWLNGYGLLLIIDHGQGFMTLYANNQTLAKTKGSLVMQGEKIATVGHSGALKQNGLYFEVRRHGKAIPPLQWLS